MDGDRASNAGGVCMRLARRHDDRCDRARLDGKHRPDDVRANWLKRLHLPTQAIDHGSLLRLEASGQVLRGQFRPDSATQNQHSALPGAEALRVVSSPAAGAHSSSDHWQTAKRSRAGDRGRVHAISISMAACLSWVSPPWRGRSLGHRHAAGRLRSGSVGLGTACCSGRGWRSMSRSSWTGSV